MKYKECTKCRQNKEVNIENYRQCKYASGNTYFKSMCRVCESLIQVARVKKHGLQRSKEQQEKFLAYKKEWRKLNKNKENKKYRDRIANDVYFKIRKNVSRAINHALKSFGAKKDSSIMNYLNYSMIELKRHIENLFDDKMSWSNYGIYWHIDHIIPQSCLPYNTMSDDNFKKCWALNNLRPLEAKLNMLDGSTRIRHKMYNNFFNGEI